MNEREALLRTIEENPDDTFVRLVFADWLDEHGEHEEAERQRKYPEAMEWLQMICTELNANCSEGEGFTCGRLLDFGRDVCATTRSNIEVSTDIRDGEIVYAIRDRIPEFWKAWSIVTGLPLQPDIEKKCYYSSGYCCAHEIYPDTHVAGPRSEELMRAEEERPEQGLDEYLAERRQQEFDAIQDDLEKDRP